MTRSYSSNSAPWLLEAANTQAGARRASRSAAKSEKRKALESLRTEPTAAAKEMKQGVGRQFSNFH